MINLDNLYRQDIQGLCGELAELDQLTDASFDNRHSKNFFTYLEQGMIVIQFITKKKTLTGTTQLFPHVTDYLQNLFR